MTALYVKKTEGYGVTMSVTMHMLLEHWGNRVVSAPRIADTRFSQVALITTDAGGLASGGGWESAVEAETIYCGYERQAADFLVAHPEAFALGIGDGSTLASISPSCVTRFVIVKDDRPFSAVFEDARRFLLKYERWTERMRAVLFERGDYQSILDCGADVFEDFITITDSSFRLLAYTKDVPIDDPVVLRLIDEGYHAKETVDKFKRYGAVKRWQTQVGIVRVEQTRIVENPTLSYVFRMHGSYFVHVVLQCTKNPISDALVDTFQMLIDYLELYVRHDWTARHQFDKDYAALLSDLVMRRPQNRDLLGKRLERARIPYEGEYRLCVMEVDPEDDDGQRVLGYYAWRLLEMVPLGKASIFQGRLLLLVEGRAVRGDAYGEAPDPGDGLASFQEAYGGVFGVSDPFRCIVDISFAYRQARLAIEYGQQDAKTLGDFFSIEPPEVPVYRFRTYFSTYVYEHGNQDPSFIAYCVRKSVVADIVRFDCEHGTDDARILYTYLMCERRANEAAQRLHMHRNTLVYRIDRLQERFAVDLSSEGEREEIMLAFRLLPAGLAMKGE